MKYRKKQIIIEAVQYDGNFRCLDIFSIHDVGKFIIGTDDSGNPCLKIPTLEGVIMASKGDYIIRGVKGEYYPCKPDIFEMTYERCEPTIIQKPIYQSVESNEMIELPQQNDVREDDVKKLAKLFHDTYEKLAPSFGYTTREETKVFDKNSPNGKLMIATIKELKAKENTYTEEQMKECWEAAFSKGLSVGDEDYQPLTFVEYIQSIKQTKQ